MKKKSKRTWSIMLIAALIFSMVPNAAYAVSYDGICEHHVTHTAECGYEEAVPGQNCIHVHDALCGYSEPTEGKKCDYGCSLCAEEKNDGKETEISYLEYGWNETEQKLTSQINSISDYFVITKAEDFLENKRDTYYVCEDVNIDFPTSNGITSGTIDFEGDVTLIIAPGKTLTINGNIENKNNNITICGQASENGDRGIDLQIINRTPENESSVGPALDVDANVEIYGSTLHITSDASCVNGKDIFIYDSHLYAISPAAISAKNSINIRKSVLNLKAETTKAAPTGILTPEVRLVFQRYLHLAKDCI